MDQSRFWIQKEKLCLNSHVISSFGDSWEEQAFAEDAAGPLGGCIWPPRSYTCSFCRRKFRSAQALGGHMNVHRRDRARLKQISSTNDNQVVEPPSTTSLGRYMLQNPNEICNPSFDLDRALFSLSSKRQTDVSVCRPFTCSFGQEQEKTTPLLSWSSKFEETRKNFHIADLGNQTLNSLVRKRCDTPIFNEKDDANDGFIFKKRRIEDDDAHTFFPKRSNLLIGDEAESAVPLKRSPNSTLENLDLELRLGDRP